jgi:hypothetical protein
MAAHLVQWGLVVAHAGPRWPISFTAQRSPYPYVPPIRPLHSSQLPLIRAMATDVLMRPLLGRALALSIRLA